MEQRKELFNEEHKEYDVLEFMNVQHLDNSERMASEAIDQGISIYDDLRQQHTTLKRSEQKIRHINSVLGISNYIISRTKNNTGIIYGGMIFTIVFLYYIHVCLY